MRTYSINSQLRVKRFLKILQHILTKTKLYMKVDLLAKKSPSNQALFYRMKKKKKKKNPDFFPFFPELISIFHTFSRSENYFVDFHTFVGLYFWGN